MANEIVLASEFEAELAKYAQDEIAAQDGGGIIVPSLSFARGQLSIGDQKVAGNVLRCVIVGVGYTNQYYEGAYDPNEKTGPTCFAVGLKDAGLAPHANSADPQCSSCAACPKNQWAKDKSGKSLPKACKNKRRIALLSADLLGTPEEVATSPVLLATLPVTSGSSLATYLASVPRVAKRPVCTVVTEITAGPDEKKPNTPFIVKFRCVQNVPMDIAKALMERSKTVDAELLTAFPKPEAKDDTSFEPEKLEAPVEEKPKKTKKF